LLQLAQKNEYSTLAFTINLFF